MNATGLEGQKRRVMGVIFACCIRSCPVMATIPPASSLGVYLACPAFRRVREPVDCQMSEWL